MQDIIVIIIGLVVFGYLGYKIYKTLTKKPSSADKCGGCTGCSLKVDLECSTNPKKQSVRTKN